MKRFNLLKSKWISVLYRDGISELVSIEQIILNKKTIRLNFPRDEMNGIMFVFLVGLFQTYILKGGGLDNITGLLNFLEEEEKYFYLEDKYFPFMQDNSCKRVEKPISWLRPSSFGVNRGIMYTGFHEYRFNICESCIVPYLLSYQWTSPRGGTKLKSPIFGSNSLFFIKECNNLFDTIKANCYTKRMYEKKFGKIYENKTGYGWADKLEYPYKCREMDSKYLLWSLCRKLKLVRKGNCNCSFCGRENVVCYDKFILGEKLCETKIINKENVVLHPLQKPLKSNKKTDDELDKKVIKCNNLGNFNLYDKFIIFMEHYTNLLSSSDVEIKAVLVFGINYGNNFDRLIYERIPIEYFNSGIELYKLSNNICNCFLVFLENFLKVKKENKKEKEELKKIKCKMKREFFSFTELEFEKSLRNYNNSIDKEEKKLIENDFKKYCISIALKIYEDNLISYFNRQPEVYIVGWTKLHQYGIGDKLNLNFLKRTISERLKLYEVLDNRENLKSQGIWKTFGSLLEEIGKNFKIDIYENPELICNLLKLLKYNENNFFPEQMGEISGDEKIIKEKKFLRLINPNAYLEEDLKFFICVIKEYLSKKRAKLLETNIDFLLNFIFSDNRRNDKDDNYINHIWCSCYYLGVKKE